MAKDHYIDHGGFEKGLVLLEDTTKAPFGTARLMENSRVTDRGGIGPRPGTRVIGAANASTSPVTGLHSYKKSFGQDEFLVKCYGDEKEGYWAGNESAGWFRIKDGYTAGEEHGFVSSLVNTENQDYLISGNRAEPFERWRGAAALLTANVSGGATSLPVDSTVTDDVFEAKTATGSSATTLTVSGLPWATDQWAGFYVQIVGTGLVRRITANTANVLTFETLGADPGAVAFRVVRLKFPRAKISGTTIAFVNSNPDTITDSGNGFLKAGFKAGDKIVVSGAANAGNNSTFTAESVSAGTITLIADDSLTAEGAGATVAIALDAMQVIYNGTAIRYTDVPSATELTVASAHAGTSGQAVVDYPEAFPQNPRGNRFANYLGRIVVGNVRSALARDAGGNRVGYSAAGSYFVSKVNNPSDFRFAATRAAGEGDIVSTPYGGGDITDIQAQEDAFYVFKRDYIEAAKYSQDANDLVTREPIKPGTGALGRTVKGDDDVYFATAENKLTSLGRVRAKDLKPQTENIGLPIKRLIDGYDFSSMCGVEHKERLYISAKSSSRVTANDVTVVYNQRSKTFEGVWSLGLSAFAKFDGMLVGGDAASPDALELLTGYADVDGDGNRLPYTSRYATNFFNLTASAGNQQAMCGLYVEGYILPGSAVTFKIWADFAEEPFLSFAFDGTGDDVTFLSASSGNGALGLTPLGLRPMGALSAPGDDGRRHFSFRVYFPFQYANFFSVGHESSDADCDYEVSRYGLLVKEDVSMSAGRVKTT